MFCDHGADCGLEIGWELGIIHCNKSQSSNPSCTYLHLFYFMSSVIEYENDGISPTIVNSVIRYCFPSRHRFTKV
jgi:hypothetical protein